MKEIEILKNYGIPENIIFEFKKRGIEYLYDYQFEAIEKGLLNLKESFVISAPTASGKTLLAELLIIKYLIEYPDKKALYITPLKSLAKEKYELFKSYEKFGLNVAISTGDYDSSDEWLGNYDIIITTIEKADSLMRHNSSWLKDVGVTIVDEIHLINDRDRGATLEILIVKLKRTYNPLLLALSATIPNDNEIAEWLGAKLVRSNFRPIKLREGVLYNHIVYFLDGEKRIKKFYGDEVLDAVLDTIKEDGQCLIFVNSRNAAENLAIKLSNVMKKHLKPEDKRTLLKISREILKILEEPTDTCKKLSSCIAGGVSFHHAGLLSKHREFVEKYFRDRIIKVIVATPTLAAGVNLPARRVIVRDYVRYDKRGLSYLPVFEVKQMFGRCLVEDTIIKTNLGFLTINEILRRFDDIYFISYNFKKKKFEPVKPIYFTKRIEKRLLSIKLKNTEITLTEDHPILSYSQGLLWKEARDLKPGDYVIIYDRGKILKEEILHVYNFSTNCYVYDFYLERNHNFIANNFLVHNSGRPEYDEIGEAFLIAKSKNSMKELIRRYIISSPEKIESKLAIERNLRFHILGLIASEMVNDIDTLINILKDTFYYYQYRRIDFEEKIYEIIEFLVKNNLIKVKDNEMKSTPIGKRVVELYIDPETATMFITSLHRQKRNKDFFYIFTISKSYEMPKLTIKLSEKEIYEEMLEKYSDDIFVGEHDTYENILECLKISSIILDWINEYKENYILQKHNIAPGDLRSRIDVAEWLVYCLRELSKLIKRDEFNYLDRLMKRIKYGVKEELLDLVRLEGIGRVRARFLFKIGIRSVDDIVKIGKSKMKKILGEKVGEQIYLKALEIYNYKNFNTKSII